MALLGILIVLVGIALIGMGLSGNAGASGGGFILIGPFPVVFGSGRYGGTLAELSLVLGVLMVALLLLRARRPFGAGRS